MPLSWALHGAEVMNPVPRHALCTDLSFQLGLDSSVIPALDLYLETVLASSQ